MKYMVISDIHGSLYYTKQVIDIFNKGDFDKLIILGDILYHGPRNPLTKDYNPMEVYELLNTYKDKIIAVRGNCDSEVDQMVLEFDIMQDYKVINLSSRDVFITHGHLYDKDKMPSLNQGDVFIHGHYHIHLTENLDGIYYLNPGSISLPKGSSVNSYGIITNDYFKICDLMSNVVHEIKF